MVYKILANNEWITSFEGTEAEVMIHVKKLNENEQASGWNRKISYENK